MCIFVGFLPPASTRFELSGDNTFHALTTVQAYKPGPTKRQVRASWSREVGSVLQYFLNIFCSFPGLTVCSHRGMRSRLTSYGVPAVSKKGEILKSTSLGAKMRGTNVILKQRPSQHT